MFVPNGCACKGAGLGTLAPSPYGTSFGFTSPFSSPFGTSWGGAPSSPSTLSYQGGSFAQEYSANRSWYDPILEAVGDAAGQIGGELLGEMKTWLQRRIGQETWERLPETTKQSMIQQAWTDVRQRAAMNPLLVGGAVLLGLKLFKVI